MGKKRKITQEEAAAAFKLQDKFNAMIAASNAEIEETKASENVVQTNDKAAKREKKRLKREKAQREATQVNAATEEGDKKQKKKKKKSKSKEPTIEADGQAEVIAEEAECTNEKKKSRKKKSKTKETSDKTPVCVPLPTTMHDRELLALVPRAVLASQTKKGEAAAPEEKEKKKKKKKNKVNDEAAPAEPAEPVSQASRKEKKKKKEKKKDRGSDEEGSETEYTTKSSAAVTGVGIQTEGEKAKTGKKKKKKKEQAPAAEIAENAEEDKSEKKKKKKKKHRTEQEDAQKDNASETSTVQHWYVDQTPQIWSFLKARAYAGRRSRLKFSRDRHKTADIYPDVLSNSNETCDAYMNSRASIASSNLGNLSALLFREPSFLELARALPNQKCPMKMCHVLEQNFQCPPIDVYAPPKTHRRRPTRE